MRETGALMSSNLSSLNAAAEDAISRMRSVAEALADREAEGDEHHAVDDVEPLRRHPARVVLHQRGQERQHRAVHQHLGLTEEEIVTLAKNSFAGSFLSDAEKQAQLDKIGAQCETLKKSL